MASEEVVVYPQSADGYTLRDAIGTGAFATVYRATVTAQPKHEVAVKVLGLEQFNVNWDDIRKEISVMTMLRHPNVVRIISSFVQDQELWIVMPLLAGGSTAHIMKLLHPKGFKDEAILATILRETLKGLEYFHKDARIHRDIKAGNILISAKGEVQIADFGVAGTMVEHGDRKKGRSTFTGTPCWMAPEVMEQTKGYDYKADVWSFGITAMEIAFGHAPYAKFEPLKVMLLTLQEEPPTCDFYEDQSTKFSKHFASLIKTCLNKNPAKRPNATKLLTAKFFQKAKEPSYIVEHLISKLPSLGDGVMYSGDKALTGAALERQQQQQAAERAQQKAAATAENPHLIPVSAPAWAFDSVSDVEGVKAAVAEGKADAAAAKAAEEAKAAAATAAAASSGDAAAAPAAAAAPVADAAAAPATDVN